MTYTADNSTVTNKVHLRDRFVAWACNLLIRRVATKQYAAFVTSVYAAGRPALLWRLKNVRPESETLGLTYTLMDARDMATELNQARVVR